MPMSAVKVRGLRKEYDNVVALNGIDLDFKWGEIHGLLGPNGAGKTTMMHIIAGILRPTAGTVEVAGYDVIEDNMSVKEITGFLPENPPLYERLLGYEFLDFIGQIRGLSGEEIERKIEYYASLLEFEDKLSSFTGTYSKGIKQKIGIAAAMMHDPKVLILDEPASGLDPRITSVLKRHLKKWVLSEKRAIIVSTHITSFAEDLCDRISIISHGEILVTGSVEDVVSHYSARNLEEAFISAIGRVDDEGR